MLISPNPQSKSTGHTLRADQLTYSSEVHDKENSLKWTIAVLALLGAFLISRACSGYQSYLRLKVLTHSTFVNEVVNHYFLPRLVALGGGYAFTCFMVARDAFQRNSFKEVRAQGEVGDGVVNGNSVRGGLGASALRHEAGCDGQIAKTEEGGSNSSVRASRQAAFESAIPEQFSSNLERFNFLVRTSQFESVFSFMTLLENEGDRRALIFGMIEVDIDKFFELWASYECSDNFKIRLIWDEAQGKVNDHRSVLALINCLQHLGIQDGTKKLKLYRQLKSSGCKVPSPYLLGFSESISDQFYRDDLAASGVNELKESFQCLLRVKAQLPCSYIHKLPLTEERGETKRFSQAVTLIGHDPHSVLRNLKLFELPLRYTKDLLIRLARSGMGINLEGFTTVGLGLDATWVKHYKDELSKYCYLGYDSNALKSCLCSSTSGDEENYSDVVVTSFNEWLEGIHKKVHFTELGIKKEHVEELKRSLASICLEDQSSLQNLIQIFHSRFKHCTNEFARNQALALLVKNRDKVSERENLLSLFCQLLECLGEGEETPGLLSLIVDSLVTSKVEKLIAQVQSDYANLSRERVLSVLLGEEALLSDEPLFNGDRSGLSTLEFRRRARRELSSQSLITDLTRPLTTEEEAYVDQFIRKSTVDSKLDLQVRNRLINQGQFIGPTMNLAAKVFLHNLLEVQCNGIEGKQAINKADEKTRDQLGFHAKCRLPLSKAGLSFSHASLILNLCNLRPSF